LDSNWNLDDNRLNVNGNRYDNNRNRCAFGIALLLRLKLKTYKYLYWRICCLSNLVLAYQKARKGKTRKPYVMEFEANLKENLLKLHEELRNGTYMPEPLKIFILRDPKTRKISKSAFRDRIVHHAIINVLEPIFDKRFIYDSCANRKGKGNLFALKRFDEFKRKVSFNGKVIKNSFEDDSFVRGYGLKADIKHYFQEVDHEILMNILSRKINDKLTIGLIEKILNNDASGGGANEERNASWQSDFPILRQCLS